MKGNDSQSPITQQRYHWRAEVNNNECDDDDDDDSERYESPIATVAIRKSSSDEAAVTAGR